MIRPCFNFDDPDDIVLIPDDTDPYMEVPDVSFSEVSGNVDEWNIDMSWSWNDYGRGIYSMSVSTYLKLGDGRHCAIHTFGDETATASGLGPDSKIGASMFHWEQIAGNVDYAKRSITLRSGAVSQPSPRKPWIYDIDKAMRNDDGKGEMLWKFRERIKKRSKK